MLCIRQKKIIARALWFFETLPRNVQHAWGEINCCNPAVLWPELDVLPCTNTDFEDTCTAGELPYVFPPETETPLHHFFHAVNKYRKYARSAGALVLWPCHLSEEMNQLW